MEKDYEDIIEDFKNTDLNKNGIADRTEVKDYVNIFIKWVLTHKVILILSLLLCFSLYALVKAPTMQTAIIKQVENSTLQDTKFCINLDESAVNKKDPYILTTSQKSGKEIFGVRRAIETPTAKVINSIYFTIYENVDALNINRTNFDKMVEQETLSARKLSE